MTYQNLFTGETAKYDPEYAFTLVVARHGETLLEFATMDDSSRAEALYLGENKWQKRNGTPYRFFSKEEVQGLAEKVGLQPVDVTRKEYWDMPHNELSTERHKHESWVLRATH